MKLIRAYIRVERADEVLDALSQAGIVNATLTHVLAVGPNQDPDQSKVSMEFGRRVNRMVKLELICPDKDESMMVETIRKAACTGQPGDGVVAVQNLNRLVKIRTAKESVDAL
ncbi:P-II family nitrogen regulator [Deferrisoma camini]|uniref:P-II family nitrogen regulator n=1 Tax=Deferrisoma camini TaxID=1035120 RepID=UPI00046D4B4B|nr:P-II family nitrogen regulator [Deferrisoma camini]